MDNFKTIADKFVAELGVTEYPPNSNTVRYNTDYYGHEVRDGYPRAEDKYPWCMVFIWWVLRVYKTASCTSFVNWAKQRGKFRTSRPKVGDCVLFNFNKNPKQGVYKHIGWIYKIENDYLITIEGNTSSNNSGSQDNGGCVAMRRRKIDNHITGYITIDYGTDEKIITRPTLRQGSKGEDVKYLHGKLRELSYGVDANSDYFDSLTKSCVMHLQASHYLPHTGVCDDKVWAILE